MRGDVADRRSLQLANGDGFLRGVHHRWRAGHGGSRDAELPRFLQVALAFRQLTGAEGAGATGEQQRGALPAR